MILHVVTHKHQVMHEPLKGFIAVCPPATRVRLRDGAVVGAEAITLYNVDRLSADFPTIALMDSTPFKHQPGGVTAVSVAQPMNNLAPFPIAMIPYVGGQTGEQYQQLADEMLATRGLTGVRRPIAGM